MKVIRYVAAVLTILMSLANLPVAFANTDQNTPTWLAWAATLLGVAGLVAAVALLRRLAWGAAALPPSAHSTC